MSEPETGASMRAYCDCANRKVEDSTSSVAGSVETTWICVTEFKDTIKTGLFSSTDRYRHYWECLNCGKRRLIGTWDAKGYSYGE